MNPGKVTRPVLCLAPVHAEVGGYPELLHGHGVHGREVGLHQLHAALVVVADAEVLQVVIMFTHSGHTIIRAANKPLRRFHYHREGPYWSYVLVGDRKIFANLCLKL